MRRLPYRSSRVALTLIVALIGFVMLALLTATRPLAASPMIFARTYHSATRLGDGRVLVTGGDAVTGAEIYDPATDQWSLAEAMRVPRQGHGAILLNDGRVLVVGGNLSSKDVEIYNTTTNRWEQAAPLHIARGAVAAALLNDGRVLVVGGGAADARVEIYDPVADTWTFGAANPGGIGSTTITAITLRDGRVLVAGSASSYVQPLTLYDPATDRWAVIALGNNSATQAAPLPDGRVLIISINWQSITNPAFLFRPTDNTVQQVAPRPCFHSLLSLTTLADGRVLTLNSSGYGTYSCSALYDPASDRWFRAADPVSDRYNFTTTLLHDSVVLLAGGAIPSTGGPMVEGSSELYDVATAALDESTFLPLIRQMSAYPYPTVSVGPTSPTVPTVTPYVP